MRPKVWLIIDGNSVAWQSHYTTGALSHEGKLVGTIFGFFQTTLKLMEDQQTQDVIFCFDGGGESVRIKKYPSYKIARRIKERNLTHEEAEIRREVKRQILDLQYNLLPEIGFRNIFAQPGYEGDDCIASVCNNWPRSKRDVFIIVSGDHDLYQCLDGERTILWNLHAGRAYNESTFRTHFYGIKPSQWAWVKAIAGCKSDSIPGIYGVGEKTAARFIAKKLPKTSAKYSAIVKGEEECRENIPLVKLPYPGTKVFKPKEDEVTKAKWKAILKSFQMKELLRYF